MLRLLCRSGCPHGMSSVLQAWDVDSKCVLFVSEGFKRLGKFAERAVSRVAKRKSGAGEKTYSAGMLGVCR